MHMSVYFLLALFFAVTSFVAANRDNYSYVGKDGLPCGLLRCRKRCRYGLQLDDNGCPKCLCVVRNENLCLDKTKTWVCYGAHTSLDIFPETSRGPLLYVDGQSTTGTTGHVAELEYVAAVSGVEVRFMIFQLALPTQENVLRITHEFRHTAATTGLIKVPLDIQVPEKSRIGFAVPGNDVVPMKYRVGKRDGSHYMSFTQVQTESDIYSFDEGSANRQYAFRICYDVQTTEVSCPAGAPVPTTPTTTTTTTTEAAETECETCRQFCAFGFERDPQTGCNICDQCVVLRPPIGTGGMSGPIAPGDDRSERCDIVCTQQWEPICGSNNRTFSNNCHLRQANCGQETQVTMVHRGECGRCDFACIAQWNPVCGSDMVIHSNLCTLFLASCTSGTPIRQLPMDQCSR